MCTTHNTDVLLLFPIESLVLLVSRSADVFASALTNNSQTESATTAIKFGAEPQAQLRDRAFAPHTKAAWLTSQVSPNRLPRGSTASKPSPVGVSAVRPAEKAKVTASRPLGADQPYVFRKYGAQSRIGFRFRGLRRTCCRAEGKREQHEKRSCE